MVGKRTVPDNLLARWRSYRDQKQGDGLTNWKIAQAICSEGLASRYCTHTVYRWIDDKRLASTRLCGRRSERHRKIAKQRGREKSRRRRAEHGDKVRLYERHYRHVTRNSDKYLHHIFANRQQADLETITNSIRAQCEHVNFGPKMIQRVVEKHIQGRSPPYLARNPDGKSYHVIPEPETQSDDLRSSGPGGHLLLPLSKHFPQK